MQYKPTSQWIQRINDDQKGRWDIVATIRHTLNGELVATIHADVDRTAYFDLDGVRLDGQARLIPVPKSR